MIVFVRDRARAALRPLRRSPLSRVGDRAPAAPIRAPARAIPSPAATDYDKALADAPPPLAGALRAGERDPSRRPDAYEERIEELRGHPVVVNKWASWCGPCRAEFPFFQTLAEKRGEEIAFLGIDAQDSDDAAATFLEELPVPYPSYSDPDLEISKSLGAEREFPATIFYDADGEIAYVHRGGYQDEADLAADIDATRAEQADNPTMEALSATS